MDAGEYDTNTLLINNLSSIAYRIYEPVASHSSAYTFAASDVEDALRSDGHLVYMDAIRRGIWCFYLTTNDAPLSNQPEQWGLLTKMEVCGYLLGLVEEGNYEPVSLFRSRSPGSNSINTPTSSSPSGPALDMTIRGAQSYNVSSAAANAMIMDSKIPPSQIQDVKGYSSIPVREMHEFFITAALSSLTTSFCQKIGAISLNHRTVLLPSQAFDPEDGYPDSTLRTSALATFRIYLTTTGSLVISLHVSLLQGLVSSAETLRSNILPGSPIVLAAPLGAFGALQGVVDGELHPSDGGFGQSPDTQISRLKPDPTDRFSQWKTTCSKLLQMRGMSPSLLDNCSWLNIHFLQRKPYEQKADGRRTPLFNPGPTAPWPSVLCFRKPQIETLLDHRFEKVSLTSPTEHMDPLNESKAWCQGLPEREDAIMKRKKDREVAQTRETTDVGIRNNQFNGYSPLTLRRSSNGGTAPAVGAMYPTPPDGVQQALGITSTFEGVALSPANQILPATDTTMHNIMQHNTVPITDTFSGGWSGPEIKREQQQVTSFLEGDAIFGDLGDDMFEGNELTEADFNFFDEQPGVVDLNLSALPDIEPTLDMSSSLSHAAIAPSHTLDNLKENKPITYSISPEFTKPELKHARSTLAEESRQLANIESFNANSSMGIKRHPSPFNPDTVYKRVRASLHMPPQPRYPLKNIPYRRGSVFEKVDFDPSLSLTNKKYQESGPFDYTIPVAKEKEHKRLENGRPQTTGSLVGVARQRRHVKELPSNLGLLLAQISGGLETSPGTRDDAISNSDDTSWASDQDDSSDTTTGEPSSPAKSSAAKRRTDDDTISMAASFKDLENASADSPAYGSIDLSRLSCPEVPELSISKYFADPEPVPIHISCSDDNFITIAQILTEQAASGSLKFTSQSLHQENRQVRRSWVNAIRYTTKGLRMALPRSLAGANESQLRTLIDVQDVPLSTHQIRVQPRPMNPELARPNIFQIPVPHVALRRYETPLSVLPTAINFWETLGLGPSQGPKDIISICVYPQLEGMRDCAVAFLQRVQSVYEVLKLGAFDTLPNGNGIADGLVPFANDEDMASPGLNYSTLSAHMANLGQALAASSLSEKNFVVYFVYSTDNPSSVVDACSAFQELFEYYKRYMSSSKKSITNDLVLQLVPLDMMASPTSLVILAPSEYARLCIEVYDRCTLFGGSMPAPAIVLEGALLRQVDFKVTTSPSPDLLHENSCMHIAYAQSVDERWVTAAWTDNRGSKQMTASYCLGRRGKPLSTPILDVVHEIWETTHDLISLSKVHWRIVVTKCAPMDQQEVEYWIGLAQTENKATVNLTLLTVDTNPSLQLVPPIVKTPLSATSVFYTTPVSTPQPSSIVSPDQSGNPPTPMGAGSGAGGMGATTPGGGDNAATESDLDATLVDITDATWGIVVLHRLNNSTSLIEMNPAIASGYLIKRGGPRLEDAPVVMEVNIIHCDSNPRLIESLLREMLTYFRGLGTLARARGLVDKETDVRPWHVAAAEKAVRVLYQLM
ncbi:mediator complex subunit 13 C-terminal-domain-containing protein [Bombardia bombarda]|uniref:Mediator of RNA polymerase II transcription subunit 13 n=1 Tax=Bombardia bombarda TaxID=252184 RepID=A0AA39X882_9PEZI|nr:mediator complex subunit 13 C-terminal-domain-containing protein [Bombardia bombarda]